LGECNYYLKARFPTAELAVVASSGLSELLGQGEAARDYWQSSRPHNAFTQRDWQPPTDAEFWAGFRECFPLVHKYLGELAGTTDWSNGLAGQLSCMVDPRVKRQREPNASLMQDGETLYLKLSGIWHCAELGRLERYCVRELGALATGSISGDAYADQNYEDGVFFDALAV
jgi:hypothetical protein